MRAFHNRVMGELGRQLSIGLLRLRMGYIDAAEALIEMISPEDDYPYEFVVFRITGYKPRTNQAAEILRGESLLEDLQASGTDGRLFR